MSAAVLSPAVEAPSPKKPLVSRKSLIAVGAAVAVAGAGAILIAMPKSSVSTDDAYVQADSSTVAPKVGGLVAQVLVDHNQPVPNGRRADSRGSSQPRTETLRCSRSLSSRLLSGDAPIVHRAKGAAARTVLSRIRLRDGT